MIRLAAGDLVPADARLLEAAGPPRAAGRAHRRVAAGREGGGRLRAPPRPTPASRRAERGLPRHLGRERHGDGAGRGAPARRPRSATSPRAWSTRPPETEFERGTRQFGVLIMQTVVFLVLFVFLVSALLHRDVPRVVPVRGRAGGGPHARVPADDHRRDPLAAARCAWRASKVIVKHLAAIQNFGSMDILCSDKTGHADQRRDGTRPRTSIRSGDADRDASARARRAQQRLPDRHQEPAGRRPSSSRGGAGRRRTTARSTRSRSTSSGGACRCVVEDGGGALLITKGAPESVLPVCTTYEVDGRRAPARRGDAARAAQARLPRAERRGLPGAGRRLPRGDRARPCYAAGDERDLSLAGFVAFLDPPLRGRRRGARARSGRDGVEVKILTGDNELVARHVCAQVGLDACDASCSATSSSA